MIDEERPLPPVRSDHESDGYLYDFFKFQTQLSLLTLAGVFAVTQMQGASAAVGKVTVLIIMGTVTAGGIAAFMGASELVRAKAAGLSPRRVPIYAKLAPGLYALGVGGFLMMFADVLM